MQIFEYQGKHPQIAEEVFLAAGVRIIGDVKIGRGSSIWFNSVIRGDVDWIEIGDYSNIQDGSVGHVMTKKYPLKIGSYVTIGHKVMLHGCEIGDECLIGMGAILLDNCKVGKNSLIAAGSLLTEGTQIPSGVLAMGSPCKVKRKLTEVEITSIKKSAEHYYDLAQSYINN